MHAVMFKLRFVRLGSMVVVRMLCVAFKGLFTLLQSRDRHHTTSDLHHGVEELPDVRSAIVVVRLDEIRLDGLIQVVDPAIPPQARTPIRELHFAIGGGAPCDLLAAASDMLGITRKKADSVSA